MPEDLHEWVSFEDPDEDRTWVFDLTFLTSPWRCIFGDGCEGVLTGPAADLEHGCCSYGAHFVDEDDEAATLAFAERLTARSVAAHGRGPQEGRRDQAEQGGRDQDPRRRRRLHLPEPARLRRRQRLRAAPGRAGGRRASARLEARRVLAAARCASRSTPTTKGTSPRPCGSGSGGTGGPAASSSTGGAPRTRRPSWTSNAVYETNRDEIVEMVGQPRLRPAGRAPAGPGHGPAAPPPRPAPPRSGAGDRPRRRRRRRACPRRRTPRTCGPAPAYSSSSSSTSVSSSTSARPGSLLNRNSGPDCLSLRASSKRR